MFKFYVNSTVEIFDNKEQAIDFYNHGAEECFGAEADRYYEYASVLEESTDDEKVEYNFSGEIKGVFVYNEKEDYLQLVSER